MFKKSTLFLFIIVFSSCVSKKNINYFQNDLSITNKNNTNYALKFKSDDLLVINVMSKDLDAVKSFNMPSISYDVITNTAMGTPKLQNYLVDNDGYIQFPIIGKLKVKGLTRVELVNLLSTKIKPFVNDAIVNVLLVNFKVNVLGDVKKPGMFTITNERLTVLDALALAGDTNISGERIIEIKRETDKGIVTGLIDLKSNALFSSPFFYLQQNDVVYVNPNKARIQSASYNQNTGLFISIGSVLISLISILTR
jgi:polysaccharide export outer membrane protein